ncbi:hypothetical protein PHYC_03018 [Phycisphaerales bacterium]|nr:hypothetical protein PHYC_03018 [Phycisphaerales bacterium]
MFVAVNHISPDLVPAIFDPALGLALLRVTGVEGTVDAVTGIESGVVKATVVRTLRPDTPAPGAPVSFPFARLANEELRFRNGANAWNTLRLEKDALLLVAWAAADASRGVFSLTAASSPASDADPEIAEIREAVEIHALAAASRPPRLSKAMIDGKGSLRRYACAAVGPRGLVPRAEGVRMLSDAIASPKTGLDDDLFLADTLIAPPLFDSAKGPDAPNAAVLTTLACELVTAKPADAGGWLRDLYGIVMPELDNDPEEDWTKRRALLRAVGVPFKKMDDRLRELSRTSGQDIPLAVKLQEALAKAWKD